MAGLVKNMDDMKVKRAVLYWAGPLVQSAVKTLRKRVLPPAV